jgi:hypothetical protein
MWDISDPFGYLRAHYQILVTITIKINYRKFLEYVSFSVLPLTSASGFQWHVIKRRENNKDYEKVVE